MNSEHLPDLACQMCVQINARCQKNLFEHKIWQLASRHARCQINLPDARFQIWNANSANFWLFEQKSANGMPDLASGIYLNRPLMSTIAGQQATTAAIAGTTSYPDNHEHRQGDDQAGSETLLGLGAEKAGEQRRKTSMFSFSRNRRLTRGMSRGQSQDTGTGSAVDRDRSLSDGQKQLHRKTTIDQPLFAEEEKETHEEKNKSKDHYNKWCPVNYGSGITVCLEAEDEEGKGQINGRHRSATETVTIRRKLAQRMVTMTMASPSKKMSSTSAPPQHALSG